MEPLPPLARNIIASIAGIFSLIYTGLLFQAKYFVEGVTLNYFKDNTHYLGLQKVNISFQLPTNTERVPQTGTMFITLKGQLLETLPIYSNEAGWFAPANIKYKFIDGDFVPDLVIWLPSQDSNSNSIFKEYYIVSKDKKLLHNLYN